MLCSLSLNLDNVLLQLGNNRKYNTSFCCYNGFWCRIVNIFFQKLFGHVWFSGKEEEIKYGCTTCLASASSHPSAVWCSQNWSFLAAGVMREKDGSCSSRCAFAVTRRLACCCSPLTSCVAYRNRGIFLGIDIGGGYKALLVSPERTTPCSFPAAQRQLRQRGNPSLSNLAVDGDLLCVLVKCNELVTDSLRKSCIIFLLKWLATVHVCTTQEKHLSWICTCLSSWRNRFYTLLLIISLGFIIGWHF
jgi:hypothetical protein